MRFKVPIAPLLVYQAYIETNRRLRYQMWK